MPASTSDLRAMHKLFGAGGMFDEPGTANRSAPKGSKYSRLIRKGGRDARRAGGRLKECAGAESMFAVTAYVSCSLRNGAGERAYCLSITRWGSRTFGFESTLVAQIR